MQLPKSRNIERLAKFVPSKHDLVDRAQRVAGCISASRDKARRKKILVISAF
jgi:hypothetical protein